MFTIKTLISRLLPLRTKSTSAQTNCDNVSTLASRSLHIGSVSGEVQNRASNSFLVLPYGVPHSTRNHYINYRIFNLNVHQLNVSTLAS
jgi:hypothetical protein